MRLSTTHRKYLFLFFLKWLLFSQEKIIKLCDCLLLTASRAPSKSVVTGSRCLLRSATKVFFNEKIKESVVTGLGYLSLSA